MIQITSYIGYPFSSEYVRYLLRKEIEDSTDPTTPIIVRIDSLGGDIHEALKIREDFRTCSRPIHAYITGFTASAATIIATGAARVHVSPTALVLVHQSLGYVNVDEYLNKDDLAHVLDEFKNKEQTLQTIDNLVASIYSEHHPSTSPERYVALMKEARWLTAAEALKEGLVDEIKDLPRAATTDDDDDDTPTITARASITAQIAAIGLPALPALTPVDAPRPQMVKSLFSQIKKAFTPTPTTMNTTNPQAPTAPELHEAQCPTLSALLNGAPLQANAEGTVQLAAQQATDLETSVAALQSQVNDLRAQLEALDGDQTTAALPTASEPDDQLPGAQATAFFQKFKNII